ncbi:unnamed protein product [Protopolystoma xenopodis]|uniref:Uncharacterized protein n=1 Tax=Protopolystoma xenopodis TaxID=117903 RepID=A0A3S5A919_9PLAT|nr:unnamed protein product [Protopolystoma xenopodis]
MWMRLGGADICLKDEARHRSIRGSQPEISRCMRPKKLSEHINSPGRGVITQTVFLLPFFNIMARFGQEASCSSPLITHYSPAFCQSQAVNKQRYQHLVNKSTLIAILANFNATKVLKCAKLNRFDLLV